MNKQTARGDLDELVTLLEGSIKNRQLQSVLRTLYDHRDFCVAFHGKTAEKVFSRLYALSNKETLVIENELALFNTPPTMDQSVSGDQEVWALVSSVIFRLALPFSERFAKTVVRSCLIQPTILAFSLLHSDGISALAARHQDIIDLSLLEILISSTDDSRTIYALKIGKTVKNWVQIRTSVFEAMLFGSSVKRVEAMWFVNERAELNEVLSFAMQRQLFVPLPLQTDVREVTRWLSSHASGSSLNKIAYTVRGNEGQLSLQEASRLSFLLEKLLE